MKISDQLGHELASARATAVEVLVLVGVDATRQCCRCLADAGDREEAIETAHRLEAGGGDEQHIGSSFEQRFGGDLLGVLDAQFGCNVDGTDSANTTSIPLPSPKISCTRSPRR